MIQRYNDVEMVIVLELETVRNDIPALIYVIEKGLQLSPTGKPVILYNYPAPPSASVSAL